MKRATRLGVWPRNSDRLVDEWLSVTGLDAQTPVEVGEHGLMSLRSALTERMEIAHISRDLVRFVQERTGNTKLAELLKPENKAELSNWTWGRQSVDLLAQLPVSASAHEWLRVLKRLQPRAVLDLIEPQRVPGGSSPDGLAGALQLPGRSTPRGVLDLPCRPLPRRSSRCLSAAIEQFPAAERVRTRR